MNRIEKAIINRLYKNKVDMKGWDKPLNFNQSRNIMKVYGKVRLIRSIAYHMEGMSFIIDSVNFETVKE